MKTAIRILVLAAALIGVAAPAQPAQAPGLAALKLIATGQWEFRERNATAPAQRICVADPIALMQIRHGAGVCSRYVIDDQPRLATMHYTCPGAGHGRTTIRVETRTLIQLHSQGIAQNAPFAMAYEGRHAGACR